MDSHRECIERGECRPRHKAHKNTREWCRGRVGIPHAYMYEPDERFMYRHTRYRNRWYFESLVCFGCGRVGRMWARITCRLCGARRRMVWNPSLTTGVTRSAWACDCPDNRHDGWAVSSYDW